MSEKKVIKENPTGEGKFNLLPPLPRTPMYNRVISEGGRLISDLLEISNLFKLDQLLATIDIQKAFDSIDYSFLISREMWVWQQIS